MSVYDEIRKTVAENNTKRRAYESEVLTLAARLTKEVQEKLGFPGDHISRLPFTRENIPPMATLLPEGCMSDAAEFHFGFRVRLPDSNRFMDFRWTISRKNGEWFVTTADDETRVFPPNEKTFEPLVKQVGDAMRELAEKVMPKERH